MYLCSNLPYEHAQNNLSILSPHTNPIPEGEGVR